MLSKKREFVGKRRCALASRRPRQLPCTLGYGSWSVLRLGRQQPADFLQLAVCGFPIAAGPNPVSRAGAQTMGSS